LEILLIILKQLFLIRLMKITDWKLLGKHMVLLKILKRLYGME
jgi:hypothetical protein